MKTSERYGALERGIGLDQRRPYRMKGKFRVKNRRRQPRNMVVLTGLTA